MIAAVIFAGGKSSRMGQDKALLPFGSFKSMTAHQYHTLQSYFDQVYISSKDAKFDLDAPLLLDRYREHSPMVALASALEQTEEEALFVLSVDMPHIDGTVIKPLLAAYHTENPSAEIIIAKSPHGLEPLCALYHRSILPKVQHLLSRGEHRMHTLLEQAEISVVSFSDEAAFVNLNTPQEYRAIHP